MITGKLEVEKIRWFDDNLLLNHIVDKIWSMDLEKEGNEHAGNFNFEVETSDVRLVFFVKGTIIVYGYTEDDTNSFVVESVSSGVGIIAEYDGEIVDFNYNDYEDFGFQDKIEKELRNKR